LRTIFDDCTRELCKVNRTYVVNCCLDKLKFTPYRALGWGCNTIDDEKVDRAGAAPRGCAKLTPLPQRNQSLLQIIALRIYHHELRRYNHLSSVSVDQIHYIGSRLLDKDLPLHSFFAFCSICSCEQTAFSKLVNLGSIVRVKVVKIPYHPLGTRSLYLMIRSLALV
jgi:hypothetical protein